MNRICQFLSIAHAMVLLKHTRQTLPFQPVAVLVVVSTRSYADPHNTTSSPPSGQTWFAFDCAQHSHPPNPERAMTRSCPKRAPSERARSASKEGDHICPHPLLIHANNFINRFFVRGVKCALRQRFTTFLLTSACVG
jgi:hypothetical protein